ncbi:MAG: MFS transporter [Chloroflexota bacterium]
MGRTLSGAHFGRRIRRSKEEARLDNELERQKALRNKQFLVIALCGLLFQIAMTLQSGVQMNFYSQHLGLNGEQVGWISSIREIPGLLSMVLAMVAVFFTEGVMSALCAVLLGIGIFLFAPASNLTSLIIPTTVMSIGFHLFSPVQSSMILRTAGPGQRATRMGQLNSINAAGAVISAFLVWLLFPRIQYKGIFYVAAGIAFVAAGVIYFARREGKANLRKSIVFKWKYIQYYLLTLLGGSRRHINQTFAALLMVERFGCTPATIATLMVIANILAILTRPVVGGIIDRLGEGKALTFSYSVITVLFVGYAFAPQLWMVYALFIIDNLFLGFEMAITTFLDKIAPREDVQPSLQMGQTINHIAGVSVPVFGGVIWKAWGPAATFLLGAAICGLSLLQAARVPRVEADTAVAD